MKVSYYRFEREAQTQYASRMVATSSTHDHSVMENNRAQTKRYNRQIGALYIRLVIRPENYGKSAIKPDFSVSMGSFNLSSVKPLNLSTRIAFGDVNYTKDSILFVLDEVEYKHGSLNDGAVIEMYVFEGQKNNQQQIAQRFAMGDALIIGLCEEAKRRAINEQNQRIK